MTFRKHPQRAILETCDHCFETFKDTETFETKPIKSNTKTRTEAKKIVTTMTKMFIKRTPSKTLRH